MSWQKRLQKIKFIVLFFSAIFLSACGVKGDPLPPEKPTSLGRGRPTYRRATEGIKLENYNKENEEDPWSEKPNEDGK